MNELFKIEPKREFNPNPCIRLYGYGPKGTKCKTCKFLYCHGRTKNYYKCEFRKFSHGKATDHKVRWDSCGKYKAEK